MSKPILVADEIARLAAERGGKVLATRLPEPDREGVYVLEIPGWRPTFSNELKGHHMKAARLKKNDFVQIAKACLAHRVPPAVGKRRVTFTITAPFRRWPDDDAPLKSGLDALKRAGAIVDDSREFCDWSRPEYAKGPKGTVITLEDVA